MARDKRIGFCRACLVEGKLTDDHVPPKGSHPPARVWIRSAAPTLQEPDPRVRRLSQNGMKFRTLCSHCNNELLGRRYDPALNHLSRKVGQLIRVSDRLELPPRVDVQVRPQGVARAVIGHLLAAEEFDSKEPRRTETLDGMREYFRDPTAEMPERLKLYFWPYRGLRQTVLRGVCVAFGFAQVSPPLMVVGDFLKYFPAAFWLAFNVPDAVHSQLADRELDPRGLALDEEVALSVPTRPKDTFAPDWPEHPTAHETLLLNELACVCAERA